MNECGANGCGRPARALGYCHGHYARLKRSGDLREDVPLRKFNQPCSVARCEKKAEIRGLCDRHYKRLKRYGDPEGGRDGKTMEAGRRQNGTGCKIPSGYIEVYAPEHQNANAKGTILQHRLMMSNSIGRPLLPGESVHHINGVRDDNRIENLELWTTSHPSGQRVEDKVKWAREIIALYGDMEQQ